MQVLTMLHFLVMIWAFTIDLNNIYLNDGNFDENGPGTIIHVRLMSCCDRCKHRKACKKEISKEVMAVARHPARWPDLRMSKDKKRNKTFLIDKK